MCDATCGIAGIVTLVNASKITVITLRCDRQLVSHQRILVFRSRARSRSVLWLGRKKRLPVPDDSIMFLDKFLSIVEHIAWSRGSGEEKNCRGDFALALRHAFEEISKLPRYTTQAQPVLNR